MTKEIHVAAREAIDRLPIVTDTIQLRLRIATAQRQQEVIAVHRDILKLIDDDTVIISSAISIAQCRCTNNQVCEIHLSLASQYFIVAHNNWFQHLSNNESTYKKCLGEE